MWGFYCIPSVEYIIVEKKVLDYTSNIYISTLNTNIAKENVSLE